MPTPGWTRTQRDEIVDWAANGELIGEIDEAIQRDGGATAQLSELLATYGVLPMFGFPTRVRRLVRKRPRQSASSTPCPCPTGPSIRRSPCSPRARGWFATAPSTPSLASRTGRPPGREWRRSIRSVRRCGLGSATPAAQLVEPVTEVCPICTATLRLIPMHQPSGFRTTYRQEDFDDENDESPSAGAPSISVSGPPDREVTIDGSTLLSYDQAQLVQVNDNNGTLFPVAKDGDGSYLVTDPSLFPDVKGWPPSLRRSRRSP